ncbi:trem-like transcript 4 protein [Petaurus breviceps papuanus]|uniref:trem-like transcript 4 protein n=1 Tax=Petaurus breviceps papuanus TaxID=3040969 RepID=UPI0036DB2822
MISFSGSQGQVFQVKYKEGETLRGAWNYSPHRDENRWKTWEKLSQNKRRWDTLIARKPDFTEQYQDPRVFLEDDTYFGTITITMANLTVEDSGYYRCRIYDSVHKTIDVTRRIRLEVSPVLKTTTETPVTTPVTTSSTALINSSLSNNQKFIVVGSVLVSLLLVGLLSAGIVYTVKISRKRGTGDDDCHHVYDDLEEQKKKARDVTIEMEEGSEAIQYASVIHGTQLSLGDSIYANTQMEYNPGSTPIPSETVEYASIVRTGHQLPK